MKTKTATNVMERRTHNGPSAEQWATVGAQAEITIKTRISALSNHGNYKVLDNIDDFSLDLLELADANPHKDNVGGEGEMSNIIGNKLLALPNVKEVYYYAVGEDHCNLITQDQDDLSNQIA